jgi:polyisoprenoid-binding protein YceI
MFKKEIVCTAIGFALGLPVLAETGNVWKIDAMHSDAHFSVRHLMISNVDGDLGHITGTVNYDGKDLKKANVEATIDVNTINTREEKRDGHLKSPDFFDAAKFPSITFKSTKIEPTSGDNFKMTGDVTIHGVTKEVVLDGEITKPIKDPQGNPRMGASATAKLNRKDFGLKFDKKLDDGNAIVGDDVKIKLDLELTQPKVASTEDGAKKETVNK